MPEPTAGTVSQDLGSSEVKPLEGDAPTTIEQNGLQQATISPSNKADALSASTGNAANSAAPGSPPVKRAVEGSK
jgi:hypothetical protein